MTDFSGTWPTFGLEVLELGCRPDKDQFITIFPSDPTSRPKYSWSPSFIPKDISESFSYHELSIMNNRNLRRSCHDCRCFPWMSHLLHNSQRKRLGTILIWYFRRKRQLEIEGIWWWRCIGRLWPIASKVFGWFKPTDWCLIYFGRFI